MAHQVNISRILCATTVGLALIAAVSAIPDRPQTLRADELAKLVQELRSAVDVGNAAAGRPLPAVQSNEHAANRPRESATETAPTAQLVGQSAAAATRRASPTHNGSQRGSAAEEVTSHPNTGIIPSRQSTAPTESPFASSVPSAESHDMRSSTAQAAPFASSVPSAESHDMRSSTAQAARIPAGPRPPSVFYPRGSVRPGTATASRSSTSSDTVRYTTSPMVVTTTTQPQRSSYTRSPSVTYSRTVPVNSESPAPTSSSHGSWVYDRQESLQQIKENLERLAEVVKLLALKVADEQQAYAQISDMFSNARQG